MAIVSWSFVHDSSNFDPSPGCFRWPSKRKYKKLNKRQYKKLTGWIKA